MAAHVSAEGFRVVPAAYLLLLRGDGPDLEVLLQLRGPDTSFMSGHWDSAAAGHVEYGESVFAAAAREAAEELGVRVEPEAIEPLCAMQRTQPGNRDPIEQRVDFFLSTRSWSGVPSVQEPGKCTGLGWFRLLVLPSPVVPHEREVLVALAVGRVPSILTFGF